MRLFYFASIKLPTTKAHGFQIMKACEAFAENGIETTLLVPYRFNPETKSPFEFYGVKKNFKIKEIWSIDLLRFHQIPQKLSFYINSAIFSLLSLFFCLANTDKKDIIYSRSHITLVILAAFGIKPVAEIHDYRSSKPSSFFKVVIKKSKKIIANSSGTVEAMRKHYKIPDDKISVMPNGVDVESFDIEKSQSQARQELGLPLGGAIIMYVGRLETVGLAKGIDDLISAYKLVKQKQTSDVSLCIVGGPDKAVVPYKEMAGDDPQIVFTGHVAHALIPSFLRAADILVIPFPMVRFSFTASPLKAFEYMAAGKCIISSDIPTIRPYLNENNALFFKSEDVESLAEKISFALKNPGVCAKLSHQAQNDARQYSWSKRAHNILNFIS